MRSNSFENNVTYNLYAYKSHTRAHAHIYIYNGIWYLITHKGLYVIKHLPVIS